MLVAQIYSLKAFYEVKMKNQKFLKDRLGVLLQGVDPVDVRKDRGFHPSKDGNDSQALDGPEFLESWVENIENAKSQTGTDSAGVLDTRFDSSDMLNMLFEEDVFKTNSSGNSGYDADNDDFELCYASFPIAKKPNYHYLYNQTMLIETSMSGSHLGLVSLPDGHVLSHVDNVILRDYNCLYKPFLSSKIQLFEYQLQYGSEHNSSCDVQAFPVYFYGLSYISLQFYVDKQTRRLQDSFMDQQFLGSRYCFDIVMQSIKRAQLFDIHCFACSCNCVNSFDFCVCQCVPPHTPRKSKDDIVYQELPLTIQQKIIRRRKFNVDRVKNRARKTGINYLHEEVYKWSRSERRFQQRSFTSKKPDKKRKKSRIDPEIEDILRRDGEFMFITEQAGNIDVQEMLRLFSHTILLYRAIRRRDITDCMMLLVSLLDVNKVLISATDYILLFSNYLLKFCGVLDEDSPSILELDEIKSTIYYKDVNWMPMFIAEIEDDKSPEEAYNSLDIGDIEHLNTLQKFYDYYTSKYCCLSENLDGLYEAYNKERIMKKLEPQGVGELFGKCFGAVFGFTDEENLMQHTVLGQKTRQFFSFLVSAPIIMSVLSLDNIEHYTRWYNYYFGSAFNFVSLGKYFIEFVKELVMTGIPLLMGKITVDDLISRDSYTRLLSKWNEYLSNRMYDDYLGKIGKMTDEGQISSERSYLQELIQEAKTCMVASKDKIGFSKLISEISLMVANINNAAALSAPGIQPFSLLVVSEPSQFKSVLQEAIVKELEEYIFDNKIYDRQAVAFWNPDLDRQDNIYTNTRVIICDEVGAKVLKYGIEEKTSPLILCQKVRAPLDKAGLQDKGACRYNHSCVYMNSNANDPFNLELYKQKEAIIRRVTCVIYLSIAPDKRKVLKDSNTALTIDNLAKFWVFHPCEYVVKDGVVCLKNLLSGMVYGQGDRAAARSDPVYHSKSCNFFELIRFLRVKAETHYRIERQVVRDSLITFKKEPCSGCGFRTACSCVTPQMFIPTLGQLFTGPFVYCRKKCRSMVINDAVEDLKDDLRSMHPYTQGLLSIFIGAVISYGLVTVATTVSKLLCSQIVPQGFRPYFDGIEKKEEEFNIKLKTQPLAPVFKPFADRPAETSQLYQRFPIQPSNLKEKIKFIVLENSYRIKLIVRGVSIFIYGVFVKSNYIMTVAHTLRLKDSLLPHETFTVAIESCSASVFNFDSAHLVEFKTVIFHDTKDICFIHLPMCGLHKNLSKYFAKESELDVFTQAIYLNPLRREFNKTIVKYIEKLKIDFRDGPKTLEGVCFYEPVEPTYDGMCGLPILSDGDSVFFLGIHQYGWSNHREAYFKQIFFEDLVLPGTLLSEPDDPHFSGKVVEQALVTYKNPVTRFDYGYGRFLGYFPTFRSRNNCTSFEHTVLHDKLETEYVLQDLLPHLDDDNCWFDIKHKILCDHATAPPVIHPTLLRIAIDDTIEYNFRCLTKKDKKNIAPIPLLEVINGVPGIVNPLVSKTSCGLLLKGTKEQHLLGNRPVLLPDSQLFAIIEGIFSSWERLEVASVLVNVSIKDEVRKKGKDPRAFYAGDTAFNMIGKSLFKSLFVHLDQYRSQIEMCIGMNVGDPKQLKAFNSYFRHKWMFDLDRKKFDIYAVLIGPITKAVIKWLISNCPEMEKVKFYLDSYSTELMFCKKNFSGNIFSSKPMTISGVDSTTIWNCLIDSVYTRICYYYLAAEHFQVLNAHDCWLFVKKMVPPYSKYCDLKNFGDDHLESVDEFIHQWYNPKDIIRVCDIIGLPSTNALKTGEISFCLFEEVTFLKRRFWFDTELGIWKAKLDKQSIIKSLCFYDTKSPISRLEHLTIVLRDSYAQMFMYTREEYEEWNVVVHDLVQYAQTFEHLKFLDISKIYRSYVEVYEWYLDGKYTESNA